MPGLRWVERSWLPLLPTRSDGDETAMMGDMLPADTAKVEATGSAGA